MAFLDRLIEKCPGEEPGIVCRNTRGLALFCAAGIVGIGVWSFLSFLKQEGFFYHIAGPFVLITCILSGILMLAMGMARNTIVLDSNVGVGDAEGLFDALHPRLRKCKSYKKFIKLFEAYKKDEPRETLYMVFADLCEEAGLT
jgi:hypothetical protein